MNYCEENKETCKFIQLNGIKLCCFENGNIYKVLENGYMKYYKGTQRKDKYIQIGINQKFYLKHRIIGYAFLGLEIENPKSLIDHKNFIRNDNRLANLRIVTLQENHFNTQSKGYHWNKQNKKWQSNIHLNGIKMYLGLFDKEEDARAAYLEAKAKYHIIPENSTA